MGINKNFRILLFTYISYVLVIVTLLKIIFVIFISPMGYANNFDFTRQSSCVGLWQSYHAIPKRSANPSAFVNSLVYDGDVVGELCMKSIDNFFPLLVTKFHTVGDRVDFREISFWKFSMLVLGIITLLLNAKNLFSKLIISTTFFLVFGDIANILYINALYLDFSVILASFFSIFAIIIYMTSKAKPSKYFFIFSVCFLVWLGFSKQQYMPLASLFIITLSLTFFIRWKSLKVGMFLLLLAIFVPLGYDQMIKKNVGLVDSVILANKTDTFLGAVLPEADDKKLALKTLNLPSSCLPGIGKTWYSPGVPGNHPCPELKNISRRDLIKLFLVEPSTLINPIAKAVHHLKPFYPNYLAITDSQGKLNSKAFILLKKTSFSYVINKFPFNVLLKFAFILMIIGSIILFLLLNKKVNNEFNKFIFSMLGLGGLTAFYAVFSSVFGDGYAEFSKHSVLFLEGISFQAIAIISTVFYYLKISLRAWLLNFKSSAPLYN